MSFLKTTAEKEKKKSRNSEGGVGELQGRGEEQGAERVTFDKDGIEWLFGQLDKMEAELKQGLQDLQGKLDANKLDRKEGPVRGWKGGEVGKSKGAYGEGVERHTRR